MLQVTHQAALEVACFVFVDTVLLGQLVYHADQFWKKLLRFRMIGQTTEVFDR